MKKIAIENIEVNPQLQQNHYKYKILWQGWHSTGQERSTLFSLWSSGEIQRTNVDLIHHVIIYEKQKTKAAETVLLA